jgi:adenosylmethionine-8-amino-7-oxononanoate aminotransferase
MTIGDKLRNSDRAALWHPFTQHALWDEEDFPVIVSGEGVYLFDADGRRFLDGVSSLWVNVHGHRRPEIDAAIVAQLGRVAHSTFLGLSHPPGIELAERLLAVAPADLTRVFFSDDGSTAMEAALKMALSAASRRDPRRTRFVRFVNAYHGDTIGAVSAGGIDLFHQAYQPLLFPTIAVDAPYCYRCHLTGGREPACTDGSGCLAGLEAALDEHAGEVAAVVIEPRVQGAAGMLVQPPGFVRGVRELCDRHGALMIADEVATGFGRTGAMFACGGEGVTPDLMAVGKGLSGGYLPIAATLAREDIFNEFLGVHHQDRTFFHGHSYTANPLACAAALASLDLFERDRTLENVRRRAEQAAAGLKRFRGLPAVGDLRQAGLMIGIELVRDRETKELFPAEAMIGRKAALAARARGVIVRPLGDVVVLMPPLCIGAEELAELLDAAYGAIAEACPP